MAIKTQDIDLGGLRAFVAHPEAPSGGGALVLPSIIGINGFQRDYACRLAGNGVTALVWDPYPGQGPVAGIPDALKRSHALRDGPVCRDVSKWLDHMLGEMRLEAVGVVGFCLGGRYALLLAARDRRLSACAAYYPSIENPKLPSQEEDAVAVAAGIDCPVQAMIAGINQVTVRETSLALQASLQTRRAATITHLYPEAEHGFMEKPGAANEAASLAASLHVDAFLKTSLT